ncbi:LysR family transcriptional regulator [Photobacterium sanctipauli]|uniref:LysR family transcriptional regulator n=1 Tax=Photobacterium sanctipauli TaxID=1342794 RepID=A0A2T3NBR7_9GAMM|nr:LysR family transcriptional regulator [Photobacterium sanctipauli]PSW11393.1 LysR family transcriptional regulator [Photobacterium sanctipauli]
MDSIAFDLRQLRTFVTVVESGSFSQAAKQLNQTQSAVSQLIQSLELALESKLLDRSKRPIQLTMSGRELYEQGGKLLLESRKLQDWMHSIEKGKLPRLRLGMVDSVTQLAGIELLRYLQPKVAHIHQVTGTAPELLASLQAGKSDIIITMANQDIPQELAMLPLLNEQYVIVTPKDWQHCDIKALAKSKPYIGYENWTPTGTQTNNWLRWRNINVKSQYSLDRADNVLGMVAQGLGWSLTTPTFLGRQLALLDQLECQPLPAPTITRQLVVISRKGESEDLLEKFVADVRDIILNQKVFEVQRRWDWMSVGLNKARDE